METSQGPQAHEQDDYGADTLAPSGQHQRYPFDMRDQWYPLVFASELDPEAPYGLHLLGDPVVLFRDATGEAQCVQDKCPHRSAPLSVGEVREGSLECKVHKYFKNVSSF